MFSVKPIVEPPIKPLHASGWRAMALPVIVGLLMSACGQRGPLYIPTPDTKAESTSQSGSVR